MAETLFRMADNLRAIANEMIDYGKGLELLLQEIEENADDIDATNIVSIKETTGGALAAMIIIKAIGFQDELNDYFLPRFKDIITLEIKIANKGLNKFIEGKKIRDFRNYVSAHHNRKKNELLDYYQIMNMRPLYDPQEYYYLICCCKGVSELIFSLPGAAQFLP